MSGDEHLLRIDRLEQRLKRERAVRRETEELLEDKTRDLFIAAQKLEEERGRLLAAEKTARERLENEMALARRIQTAILPRVLALEGYEIAARMVPAAEVGGDYYDVLPCENGGWI